MDLALHRDGTETMLRNSWRPGTSKIIREVFGLGTCMLQTIKSELQTARILLYTYTNLQVLLYVQTSIIIDPFQAVI